MVGSVRYFRLVAVLVVAWGLLRLASAGPPIQVDATSVVIPLFPGKSEIASAVVRIKSLRPDYQKRGFFRIGLLPMQVADGVEIEVRDPGVVALALEGTEKWFRASSSGKETQIKNVSLTIPAIDSKPCLRAAIAQFEPGGRWHLTGGVTFSRGPNSLEAQELDLQTTGKAAGDLTLATTDKADKTQIVGNVFDGPRLDSKVSRIGDK